MVRYKTTWGEPLYTLKDLSDKSNTRIPLLKEWLADGDLVSFITIYQKKGGRRYYRWGAPLDWETPIEGETFVYPLESVVAK